MLILPHSAGVFEQSEDDLAIYAANALGAISEKQLAIVLYLTVVDPDYVPRANGVVIVAVGGISFRWKPCVPEDQRRSFVDFGEQPLIFQSLYKLGSWNRSFANVDLAGCENYSYARRRVAAILIEDEVRREEVSKGPPLFRRSLLRVKQERSEATHGLVAEYHAALARIPVQPPHLHHFLQTLFQFLGG